MLAKSLGTPANPSPNCLVPYHCLLVLRLAEGPRYPLTSTAGGEGKRVDSVLFPERLGEDVVGPAVSMKYWMRPLYSLRRTEGQAGLVAEMKGRSPTS